MTAKTIFIDEDLPERTRAIIEFLLRAGLEVIGADGSSVMLLSPDGKTLAMKGMAAREPGLPSKLGITVRAGDRIAGKAVQTGETIIIVGDVQKNPDFSTIKKYQEIKSGLTAPLKADGKTLGVFNVKRTAMDAPVGPTEARIAGMLASIAAEILA